jgi:biotin carboxyl carrier protein
MSHWDGRPSGEDPAVGTRVIDPRAVRVGVVPGSRHDDSSAIVIEPPEVPLSPAPHVAGTGVFGGAVVGSAAIVDVSSRGDRIAFVDGLPLQLELAQRDGIHGVLVESSAGGSTRVPVLLMPPEHQTGPSSGVVRREVVVDGWRVEVEIESERRASLRERARRGREGTARGGQTQVRAIIPGRIVAVSVVAGDPVEAGQQLLVVEAMKMQNELRAPRDGIVSSVGVAVGGTIEVGDLLLVLE